MSNKLIVIEGLDGSGKTTQINLLKDALPGCRFITFPYYGTSSGDIITEYLGGGFCEEDMDVSAYTASAFYAVDRYTSFKKDWGKDWSTGKPVISARYVSSNAIYQMTKLDKSKWESYIDWIYDLEYAKFGLPKPAKTIFLDMPTEMSQKLLSARYNGDESKKDIHERNLGYMERCRESALYIAEKEDWKLINCTKGGEFRSVGEIGGELQKVIKEILNV